MLVDAVQSSRFITEKKSIELTKKLVTLTPHPVTASGGIRSQDDLEILEKAGVKEGDVVSVYDIEFNYVP